jgi:transcriptional regulator with XRE-family HTH domain
LQFAIDILQFVIEMKLGEKIRHLRHAEGILRGTRLSQSELARAIKQELGETISQSYLSQIENGERPHLTKKTRELLARFFKVHPSFLVDDPEGFHRELISNLPVVENTLNQWLLEGARRFRRDVEISNVLEILAYREDVRRCLLLMGAMLETPDLIPRLFHVLRPTHNEEHSRKTAADLASERAKARHGRAPAVWRA